MHALKISRASEPAIKACRLFRCPDCPRLHQRPQQHDRASCQSPTTSTFGREIRLPAVLSDEGEVARIGAQALAGTPETTFYRKNQIRFAAREVFTRMANDSALRRAELRKSRPSRGPFPIGTYVFYFDASDRKPGLNCWRGVARVIGKEGSHTIWISHRSILLAVSPEHLSRAYGQDLIDATPAAGGTGFVDLRKAPVPDAGRS